MISGGRQLLGRVRTATKPILATSGDPERFAVALDAQTASASKRNAERMGTRASFGGGKLSFIILLCLAAIPAIAAPPPETDMDSLLHAWFEAQHSAAGVWCCNIADGHILSDDEWRGSPTGYQVKIHGGWIPIPDTALRDPKGGPNPTGHAIVWFIEGDFGVHVYCFAPGWEG